jgi:hypothetical protein
MNVAPATSAPRAARRTSCLGTFLLVLVLWTFSVVALIAYLVTRSAIVRQVRVAWWAVLLAALGMLAGEVAVFEATGDGLVDLLRLHIHPWWLLLHGYGIGALLTWPLTIVACQAPLAIPTGVMAGALGVARGERLAAGAEWSPYSQRQAMVAEVHATRQVARATRRHHEPTNPALTPALGLAYPGGDLYGWLRKRGHAIEVVIPAREQRLAMAVLGIPGSGKTVTQLRRVWIAAQAGMRVIFLDCKGTDPALAWQVTCAYRLANPAAIVGYWPTQPLDCWRGDGMAIANRLLAVEDWASEGGGVYYRRMATLAIQLACTPPSGPPRNSGDFLRRLDVRKLQQLWRGDDTARADLDQLAADPTVMAGVRGRYSAFFRSLHGKADGCWGLEDVDLAVLTIPTIASRTDAAPPSAWSWKTSATSPPAARPASVMTCCWCWMSSRPSRAAPSRPFTWPNASATSASRSCSGRSPLRGLATRGSSGGCCTASVEGWCCTRPPTPTRSCSSPARFGCPSRPGSWTPGGQQGRPGCTWPTGPGWTPTRSASSTPVRRSWSTAAAPSNSRCCRPRCPPGSRKRPAPCVRPPWARPSRSMWPRGSMGRHPRSNSGGHPSPPWTSPTTQRRCRPWKPPARPLQPRTRRGTPALPAMPRQRLLLALQRAVAQRDHATVAAVVQAGRRDAPGWDPTAELTRRRAVGRWRRWRRQPGFLRWLGRVAHLRRVRHG